MTRARWVSCDDACHTVPSPLVGEGQGGGWRQNTEREASPRKRSRATAAARTCWSRRAATRRRSQRCDNISSRAAASRPRCARWVAIAAYRVRRCRRRTPRGHARSRLCLNRCCATSHAGFSAFSFSESASTDTLRALRRCAPHGSLPPCGGGTGRGVATKH